jgi:hypothetical protein
MVNINGKRTGISEVHRNDSRTIAHFGFNFLPGPIEMFRASLMTILFALEL